MQRQEQDCILFESALAKAMLEEVQSKKITVSENESPRSIIDVLLL